MIKSNYDVINYLTNLSINQEDTIVVPLAKHTEIQSNMSVPVLDIKNLSIIPTFDGNPNELHRFISASESILTHFFDTRNVNNFQNTLLLNGILNKLEGRAEEVVSINGAELTALKAGITLNILYYKILARRKLLESRSG